ncbi:MAG TPA: hypothetical protein VH085_07820 [Nocardioides sp.]|jgi:hypothetical protein|nr:hypothetical protein [Nocardioides sp.]
MDSDHNEMSPSFFRAQLDAALLEHPPSPTPVAVVAAAERNLGRRRRRLGAGVLCTAVVLGGFSWLVVGHAQGPAADPGAAAAVTPAGWRQVSWTDVSFAVPPTWVPGDPSQWCVSGPGPTVGRFSTPGSGGSTSAGCLNPTSSYGATLQPTSSVSPSDQSDPAPIGSLGDASSYPSGAWTATRRIDKDWTFVVVAPDSTTVSQIMGSFSDG